MFFGGKSGSGWDTLVTYGVVLGLALAGYSYWNSTQPHFHVVVPGRVYRSATPSRAQLEKYKERYGLVRVVNLRGEKKGRHWYETMRHSAEELGLEQIDVDFPNSKLAPIPEIKRLVEVLTPETGAVLVHGKLGAGGTSLASAVARVLAGDSLKQAREEFGWRYGDSWWEKGSHLPSVIELYSKWLVESERAVSPESFRAWVEGLRTLHYFSAQIEVSNPREKFKVGEKWTLEGTVTNTSQVTWPGDEYPMHMVLFIKDAETSDSEREEADLPDEPLRPEGSWKFKIDVPPASAVGKFEWKIDVNDGREMLFEELGSTPWKSEVLVEADESESEGEAREELQFTREDE